MFSKESFLPVNSVDRFSISAATEIVGTFWQGCEMPAMDLCLREIDLVPSSAYAGAGAVRDIDMATALLARQPVIAETLITHRFPLEAAPEAFRMAGCRGDGAIKVVLEP